MAKNLSETERAGWPPLPEPAWGLHLLRGRGRSRAQSLLGATRLEIGRRLGLIDESRVRVLLDRGRAAVRTRRQGGGAGDVAVGSGAWTAVHHAFTAPQDSGDLRHRSGLALAWAYDIVCNGNEIGGGSIRIHRRDIQERVFAVMGLAPDEAQAKFGFLLDAFAYGAPPHGGIAFGWDRSARCCRGPTRSVT